MLKKTLMAAATLALIASPVSAHDRNYNWDNGRNRDNGRYWKNDNKHYNYGYLQKPHYKQYGYWRYRPYPRWLEYSWSER